MSDSAAVYCFSDSVGAPLYVGVSADPERRTKEHRCTAPWWPEVDPSRTTVDWYPSRAAAEYAELQAIVRDRPKYNIQGIPERYFGRTDTELSPDKVAVLERLQAIEDPAERARQTAVAMDQARADSIRLSTIRYAALVELRASGVSVVDISHTLGIHRDRVYNLLRSGAARSKSDDS